MSEEHSVADVVGEDAADSETEGDGRGYSQHTPVITDEKIRVPLGAWLLMFLVIFVFCSIVLQLRIDSLTDTMQLGKFMLGLTWGFLLVVVLPARLYNLLLLREYKGWIGKAVQRVSSDIVVFGLLSCFILDTLGKVLVILLFGYPASYNETQLWHVFSPDVVHLTNHHHVVHHMPTGIIWNIEYLTEVVPHDNFSLFFLSLFLGAAILFLMRRRFRISAAARFAIGVYIGGTFSEMAEVIITGHHVTDWLSIGGMLYIDLADITQPYALGFLLFWLLSYPFKHWRGLSKSPEEEAKS